MHIISSSFRPEDLSRVSWMLTGSRLGRTILKLGRWTYFSFGWLLERYSLPSTSEAYIQEHVSEHYCGK